MAMFWGLVGGLILAAQGKSSAAHAGGAQRFFIGFVVCFIIGLPAIYYSNIVFTMILFGRRMGRQPGRVGVLLARRAGDRMGPDGHYLRRRRGPRERLAQGTRLGSLRNIVKGAVGGWVGGFVGGADLRRHRANASGLSSRLFGLSRSDWRSDY